MNHVTTRQRPNLLGSEFLKAAMLMAIGIFLVVAPAPDARVIEEITSNILVIAQHPALEP